MQTLYIAKATYEIQSICLCEQHLTHRIGQLLDIPGSCMAHIAVTSISRSVGVARNLLVTIFSRPTCNCLKLHYPYSIIRSKTHRCYYKSLCILTREGWGWGKAALDGGVIP